MAQDPRLPPGVSSNMIPGNRPEDAENEAFWAVIEEKFMEEYPSLNPLIFVLLQDDDYGPAFTKFVEMVRDLSYAVGFQEGVHEEQMAQALKEQKDD